MSNICNLCGQEGNDALTAAGLCPRCSSSLRSSSEGLSAPLDEPKNPRSTERRNSTRSYKKVKKASLIGGLVALALGVFLLIMAFTGISESSGPSTSKRTRAVQAIFGKTGTSVVLGLIASGVGAYYIATSFEDWYD